MELIGVLPGAMKFSLDGWKPKPFVTPCKVSYNMAETAVQYTIEVINNN